MSGGRSPTDGGVVDKGRAPEKGILANSLITGDGENLQKFLDIHHTVADIERCYFVGFDSRMSLIAASDFSSDEAERPTATLRTMDPLTPVRPACSEPISLIR